MRFTIDSPKLRELLIERRLPVTDAAHAAGMTRQGLTHLLDGRRPRRAGERTVYKLARILQVEPRAFASPVDSDEE